MQPNSLQANKWSNPDGYGGRAGVLCSNRLTWKGLTE